MKVNQIPLKKRLERLEKGHASDPDYITSAIVSFANTSIYDYMFHHEQENKRLREILRITEEEEKKMTYQDAAIKIKALLTKQDAQEAIRLLAEPFITFYEFYKERMDAACME